MKRGWKGAAFLVLASCVTALAAQTPPERRTHIASDSSVPAGNNVSVTVDCAKVVKIMRGGLGASWHAMETPIPYGVKHPVFSGYSHGGSGWGGYPPAEDERAWQQIYRHADWLGLDWNRVEVEQRIYEPERNVFTFDSPEMRILYRILDWHQRSGAEVFFQQMWCNAAWLAYPEFRDDPVGRVHSAPVDLDAFAEGLTTLMEHLIKKRGYTCIKWLCITNEPGANFSWWQAPANQPLSIAAGLATVRKALDRRGLKLPLSGPDTTTGFPAQVPGDLDYLGLLGAYDFHDYGADFDFRTKGHIATQVRNAAQWAALAHREGKPLFLSEFGTMAYGWVPDKPGPSSPPSVLAGSELVVRLANTGVDGFNRWSFLNRGDLDGQWQLLDTWDPQAKKLRVEFTPHPNSYFCLGLLSRFTARHSAILSSQVDGGKLDNWQRVFCAVFRSPAGNLTLAIINDAPAAFQLKLTLQTLPKSERFYRYRYGEAQQDRADVTVSPQAEFSLTPEAGELKDTLPATSLTIYSTYKRAHGSPGMIVESGDEGQKTEGRGPKAEDQAAPLSSLPSGRAPLAPTQGREVQATYIRTSPRDPRYFELSNGRPYVPIGFNLVRAPKESEFESVLDAMAAHRVNYCRIWLNDLPWQIEYQASGVYDENRVRILRRFLDLAGRRGVRVKLCLEEFREIKPVKQADKDNTLHHRANGGPFESMQEFLYSEQGQALFLRKVAFYRDHVGDHPAVFAWELWNEMDCVRADWVKWTERMLPELHRMFPKNLVVQSLGSFDNNPRRAAYRRLCTLPGNDVVQVHRYLDLGAALEVCHGPMDVLAADAVRELLAFRCAKPVLLAETGAVSPGHTGVSPLYAKDKEGMLLHDVLFAPFFAGAAGTGEIWFWRDSIQKPDLWRHFACFARTLEGIDPPAEHFEPVLIDHPRLRVYLLRGRTTLLAWCRDRQNDWLAELERGESPQRLKGLQLDLREQLRGRSAQTALAYSPWTDTWTPLPIRDGMIALPPLERSIVIKIQPSR